MLKKFTKIYWMENIACKKIDGVDLISVGKKSPIFDKNCIDVLDKL